MVAGKTVLNPLGHHTGSLEQEDIIKMSQTNKSVLYFLLLFFFYLFRLKFFFFFFTYYRFSIIYKVI